jgi:hypothetical protein
VPAKYVSYALDQGNLRPDYRQVNLLALGEVGQFCQLGNRQGQAFSICCHARIARSSIQFANAVALS